MRCPSGRRAAAVAASAVLALLSLASLPAAAQPSPRPRIGIALGGGAARGLAHLGVLRWLDEHRVPIDTISGTSMGGLIGALIATGMSPTEARDLVASLDWAQVLAPDTPFADKTFRRKEDARAFPSVIEFGLKGGFRLPTGLSPAAPIDLLLDRITLPYHGVDRFDDFPVPFRCVAVDLRTSSQVVLATGRLDNALRATMAIPGLFSPVRIGDMVLVDGGILNNVPADVAREAGADFVIAVDVGLDLSRPPTSDTFVNVLTETLNVMMRAAVRPALASADLIVVPELKNVSLTDFGRLDELERQGYAAADVHRDVLLKHALSESDYQAHLEARRARRRTLVPTPVFLTIEGVKGAQASVIRRRLGPHVGRPVDTAAIERDLIHLTGSNRYESISYRIAEVNGHAGLIVTAREKSYAPPYFVAALDLQNAESSAVSAAIRTRVTFFDVGTPGSEARLDLGVGRTTRAGAEWYLAVGRHGLFAAPHAGYTRAYVDLFSDGDLVAEYRETSRDVGIDVGYTSENRLEIRAGYGAERITGTIHVGDPVLPEVSGEQRFWQVRAVYDGQNSPVVPQKGLYAKGVFRRFTQTTRLTVQGTPVPNSEPPDLMSGEITASLFRPTGRRGRVFVSAAGGSSFGDTATVNAFTLGGPLALGALQQDELRGSNYTLANAGYLHEVATFFEGALGRLYLGSWIEHGSAFEDIEDARFETNLSGGFILETVIGPAFLFGSTNFDGRYRVYVGLGPVMRR